MEQGERVAGVDSADVYARCVVARPGKAGAKVSAEDLPGEGVVILCQETAIFGEADFPDGGINEPVSWGFAPAAIGGDAVGGYDRSGRATGFADGVGVVVRRGCDGDYRSLAEDVALIAGSDGCGLQRRVKMLKARVDGHYGWPSVGPLGGRCLLPSGLAE